MASLNKVMIIGRLGQDPEMKFLQSGQAVCEMSVATDNEYTDKGGKKQKSTEWHRVKVWGKSGEACGQHLSKGSQVFVEGRIQTRTWEKDGQKHYATEIVANSCQFLGSKGEKVEKSEPRKSQTSGDESSSIGDDEIPF